MKSPTAIAGMYDGASAGMLAGYTAILPARTPVTAIVKAVPSAGSDLQGKRLPQKYGQRKLTPELAIHPSKPVAGCDLNV